MKTSMKRMLSLILSAGMTAGLLSAGMTVSADDSYYINNGKVTINDSYTAIDFAWTDDYSGGNYNVSIATAYKYAEPLRFYADGEFTAGGEFPEILLGMGAEYETEVMYIEYDGEFYEPGDTLPDFKKTTHLMMHVQAFINKTNETFNVPYYFPWDDTTENAEGRAVPVNEITLTIGNRVIEGGAWVDTAYEYQIMDITFPITIAGSDEEIIDHVIITNLDKPLPYGAALDRDAKALDGLKLVEVRYCDADGVGIELDDNNVPVEELKAGDKIQVWVMVEAGEGQVFAEEMFGYWEDDESEFFCPDRGKWMEFMFEYTMEAGEAQILNQLNFDLRGVKVGVNPSLDVEMQLSTTGAYIVDIDWDPLYSVLPAGKHTYTITAGVYPAGGYVFAPLDEMEAYVNGEEAKAVASAQTDIGAVYDIIYTFEMDVPETEWYHCYVKAANQVDLINGKSADSYAPDMNMTYAEAIMLAVCMNIIYNGGDPSTDIGNGKTVWYSTYMDYALENGIIDYDLTSVADTFITREEYVYIFSKALPAETLKAVNLIPTDAIPDVEGKTTLKEQETALDTAKTILELAKTTLDEIKGAMTDIKTTLDDVKTTLRTTGKTTGRQPSGRLPAGFEPVANDPHYMAMTGVKTTLDGAKTTLTTAKTTLDTAKTTLDTIETGMTGVKTTLDNGMINVKTTLNGAKTTLTTAKTTLGTAKTTLNEALELIDALSELFAKDADAEGITFAIDTTIRMIEGSVTKLERGKTTLTAGKTTLDGAKTTLDGAKTTLRTTGSVLDDAKTTLNTAMVNLNKVDKLANYPHDTAYVNYKTTLDGAKTTLRTAGSAIEDAKTTLETALAYLEGLDSNANYPHDTFYVNYKTTLDGAKTTLDNAMVNLKTTDPLANYPHDLADIDFDAEYAEIESGIASLKTTLESAGTIKEWQPVLDDLMTGVKTTLDGAKTAGRTTGSVFEGAKTTLRTAGSVIDDAKTTLNLAKTTLEIVKTTLESGKTTLDEAKTTLRTAIAVLEGAKTTLSVNENGMTGVKTTLDTLELAMADAKTTLDGAKTTLGGAKTTLDEIRTTGKTTLDTAKTTLDSAMVNLKTTEVGMINVKTTLDVLDNLMINVKTTLDLAKTTLNLAKTTLDAAESDEDISKTTLGGFKTTLDNAMTGVKTTGDQAGAIKEWKTTLDTLMINVRTTGDDADDIAIKEWKTTLDNVMTGVKTTLDNMMTGVKTTDDFMINVKTTLDTASTGLALAKTTLDSANGIKGMKDRP